MRGDQAVHVFNPQVVVIGGGVTNAGELLLEPMRETVFAGLMPVFKEDLAIVPHDLGPTPGSTAPSPWRAAGAGLFPEISNAAKLQGDRFGP